MRCHQPIKLAQTTKPLLILGFLLLMVAMTSWLLAPLLAAKPAETSPSVGLQGRLLNKSGTPVPNGHYNMEFRLYQGGSGQKAGNPGGKLVWQESYTNHGSKKAVQVKSGRFAVQLGSAQPFSDGIDWSKNNLWLSMNIAGRGQCQSFGAASCQPDGELLPMKHVSATPFAISAGKLGDKSADDFVQLGQGKQVDSSDGSSIFVDKTGKGHLIQLQSEGKDSFTVSRDGDITLSGRGDRAITLTKQRAAGSDLTLQAGAGGSSGGDLELKGGDGDKGGDIVLRGGTSNDGRSSGLVIIGTPTFETTQRDANCYPNGKLAAKSCQITQASIDQSAAIVVGFSQPDQSVSLPKPTRQDPGQLRYIIGASDSEPFTVTPSGSEGSLSIMPDTATALLWNGKSWITMSAQTPATPAPADTQADADQGDSEPAESPAGADQGDSSPEQPATEDGSMYYNEELGKIQCYQDSLWGDCAAAPDVFVTISPEYANAVMNGGDLGTITSDFCSDQLNVNNGKNGQDEVCAEGETHNFYQWSTDESDSQTRSIYISYKLPANFNQFIDESTSLTARASADGANVSYRLYRDNKTDGLTACGEATLLTSKDSRWHALMTDQQADPANCQFSPGDGMLIRVDLEAKKDADAFISDINFIYSSS